MDKLMIVIVSLLLCHLNDAQSNACSSIFCKSCPDGPNRCTECVDGFSLVAGQCEICKAVHCVRCPKSPDICEQCDADFSVYVDGYCQKCKDAGCIHCPDSEDVCVTCGEGFGKADDGSCQLCRMNGCGKCADDRDECTACSPGYNQVPDTNGVKCEECEIIGCEECPDVTKCEKCYDWWFGDCKANVDDNTDDNIPDPPTDVGGCSSLGCLSSCTEDTACKVCDAHYYLDDNGECKSCFDIHYACDLCVSSKECLDCIPGYGLVTKDEKKECQVCTDGNCDTCDGRTHRCRLCNDGYRLASQECKDCPFGCAKCTSDTSCTTCKPGYSKDGDQCKACTKLHCGKCDSGTDKCDECKIGFGLENGECKLCSDSFCASCPTSPDKCEECKPDFIGLCGASPCEDTLCKECSQSPDKCTDCFTGYYISSDTCVKCRQTIPFCDECSLEGKCTKCDPKFTLADGKCGRRCDVTNCKICEAFNNERCAVCNDGFTLNDGTCS